MQLDRFVNECDKYIAAEVNVIICVCFLHKWIWVIWAGTAWAPFEPKCVSFAVLPVLLDVVRGPDRLAADEESQDLLREKLRLLQADCDGVKNLFVVRSVKHVLFVPKKVFQMKESSSELFKTEQLWFWLIQANCRVCLKIQELLYSLLFPFFIFLCCSLVTILTEFYTLNGTLA